MRRLPQFQIEPSEPSCAVARHRSRAFSLAGLALSCWLASVAAAGGVDGAAPSASHPLDPPAASEIAAAVALLHDELGFDPRREQLVYLGVDPRIKPEVLAWQQGAVAPRRLEAVVRQAQVLQRVRLDLVTGRVLERQLLAGAQPRLLHEEMTSVERLLMGDERFRAAAARRGIVQAHQLACITTGPGAERATADPGTPDPSTTDLNHVTPTPAERRLRVICYQRHGAGSLWSRPIAGLSALIAPDRRAVIEVFDDGSDLPPQPPGAERTPPIPATAEGFAEPPSAGVLPAGEISADGGSATIELAGHQVSWDRWRLHWRVDPRVGLVLATVSIADGERRRSVLYEGSVSELFVPYMDPGPDWSFRAYLDAAEFGLGLNTVSLVAGVDCPAGAHFLPAVLADEQGRPSTIDNAVCLFERRLGDAAWRHSEPFTGETGAAPRRELVVRWACVIGNYDYTLDWRLRRDGSIEVAVASSGIVQVRRIAEGDGVPGEETTQERAPHGRRIAPGLLAVDHSHFLSFRLDLDIDGPRNSFVASRWVTERLPADAPRAGVWRVESEVIGRESQARFNLDPQRPVLWRVVAGNGTAEGAANGADGSAGYQLHPGTYARPLLPEDDPLLAYAGFLRHHLWVTPFAADERYAAGEFPLQRSGGGLVRWSAADRPLAGQDLVLWHTVGFHHWVRREDWPVMPTMWVSFELRPFDFFTANPLLPPAAEDDAEPPAESPP